MHTMFTVVTCFWAILGLCAAKSALYSEESSSSIRMEQCHDGCIKKFATDDISCLQAPECSTCWDECTASTSINKSILATWALGVTSMVRENSLVSANIAWDASVSPSDCLVTWEVSGGGLIGNLLTQSSNVELSLWPDTKYRVQVTCKNKNTEDISRSLPLTLDTSTALVMVRVPTVSPSPASMNEVQSDDMSDDRIPPSDSKMYATYLMFDQPIQSSFSLTSLFENNYNELLLGICAAIAVFGIVLIAFILSKRKSRSYQDKAPLVDNEVSANVDVERLTIHV